MAGAAACAAGSVWLGNRYGCIKKGQVCYFKKCQPEGRNRENTVINRENISRAGAGAGGQTQQHSNTTGRARNTPGQPPSLQLHQLPYNSTAEARRRNLEAVASHIASTRPAARGPPYNMTHYGYNPYYAGSAPLSAARAGAGGSQYPAGQDPASSRNNLPGAPSYSSYNTSRPPPGMPMPNFRGSRKGGKRRRRRSTRRRR